MNGSGNDRVDQANDFAIEREQWEEERRAFQHRILVLESTLEDISSEISTQVRITLNANLTN